MGEEISTINCENNGKKKEPKNHLNDNRIIVQMPFEWKG